MGSGPATPAALSPPPPAQAAPAKFGLRGTRGATCQFAAAPAPRPAPVPALHLERAPSVFGETLSQVAQGGGESRIRKETGRNFFRGGRREGVEGDLAPSLTAAGATTNRREEQMHLEAHHVPSACPSHWQSWALKTLHSSLAPEGKLPLDLVFSLCPLPTNQGGKGRISGSKGP